MDGMDGLVVGCLDHMRMEGWMDGGQMNIPPVDGGLDAGWIDEQMDRITIIISTATGG